MYIQIHAMFATRRILRVRQASRSYAKRYNARGVMDNRKGLNATRVQQQTDPPIFAVSSLSFAEKTKMAGPFCSFHLPLCYLAIGTADEEAACCLPLACCYFCRRLTSACSTSVQVWAQRGSPGLGTRGRLKPGTKHANHVSHALRHDPGEQKCTQDTEHQSMVEWRVKKEFRRRT